MESTMERPQVPLKKASSLTVRRDRWSPTLDGLTSSRVLRQRSCSGRRLLGSKMREARTRGPLFRLSKSRVGSAAGCRLAETRERVQAAHQGVATYVGRRTLRGF